MTIREIFNIEFPIIQAPMAGVQNSALTLAVTKVGGLGSLPCAMLPLEMLRAELDLIQSETKLPFNLNFFSHQTPSPDDQRNSNWRHLFSHYYNEFKIDPLTAAGSASRMPFNHEVADLVCGYKPAVVSFHFGLPSADLVDKVRKAGAKIISTATTLEEALWLESHGVDAIIAQGLEAGGHRGMFLTEDIQTQIGTFALLPQIVQSVKVPVIAAGGIADAKGVKAAFDLGASGAQIGTAYLLCPEATTSTVHRKALASKAAKNTALTNVFSGRPARGIVNRMMQELGYMNPKALPFPLASLASAPLRAAAESNGSGDFSPLWAGQNTSGCKEVSARELTRELSRLI